MGAACFGIRERPQSEMRQMRWSGSRIAFWGIVLMGLISGLIMLRVALLPGGWPGGDV
ncbi:MAG: hypothetical protein HW418_3640, partial [Anaerolineales bacterium]|nr:hypothetical protein [Anaerolineales bacterium]